VKLTLAHIEDAGEIAELVNSAYRGDSSRAGWTTEADLLDDVRTEAHILRGYMNPQRGQAILVLREESRAEIIGCVYLALMEREGGLSCYLGMLTVKPVIQAKGHGRFILEGAEEFARNWGARKMHMQVITVRDSLIAWYERRGYTKTGVIKEFPNHPELKFCILEKTLI
jgi:GNAT superfamily N-acetyltransferase